MRRCLLALCSVPCTCAGRNPTHPTETVPPVDLAHAELDPMGVE